MSLTTPPTVQKLQTTLHAKAKQSPSFRFYALYDKVYRMDVLQHSYNRCRVNGGTVGVDGVTFEQTESEGVESWLGGLAECLRNKTYCPQAVRRVMIAKPNGGEQPLGIPTVADRVIQTAAVLVLEPIFEAPTCCRSNTHTDRAKSVGRGCRDPQAGEHGASGDG